MGGVVLDLHKINWMITLNFETLKNQKKDLESLSTNSEYKESEKKILEDVIKRYEDLISFFEEIPVGELPKENTESKRIGFFINSMLQPIYILKNNNPKNVEEMLYEIFDKIIKIETYVLNIFSQKNYKSKSEELEGLIGENDNKLSILNNYISQNKILSEDLRNQTIHQIYKEDSTKFFKSSKKYEISFYFLIIGMFVYFSGLTIYVNDIDFGWFTMGFPSKSNSPDFQFYIQKISILVLSTTLAAFLLKRSFMNRQMADEAYRTAKEIDGLPRYMLGMPEEMKEKIRLDLAYKYFGNGIHHESYTGGENLMHENIKANTDFIKAVKDLTPKVEVPNSDKAPKDSA